jgi:hypothetical protein
MWQGGSSDGGSIVNCYQFYLLPQTHCASF